MTTTTNSFNDSGPPRPHDSAHSVGTNNMPAVAAKYRELEEELHTMTEKVASASQRFADYENDIRVLNAQLRHEKKRNDSLDSTATTESARAAGGGGLARFGSFMIHSRKTSTMAPTPTPTPPSRERELEAQLAQAQKQRLAAERKVEEMSMEIEELTGSLFSQANEMVAEERRETARLRERIRFLEARDAKFAMKVQRVEERDRERKGRLERLERAMARIDRVRDLLGKGVRGSAMICLRRRSIIVPEKRQPDTRLRVSDYSSAYAGWLALRKALQTAQHARQVHYALVKHTAWHRPIHFLSPENLSNTHRRTTCARLIRQDQTSVCRQSDHDIQAQNLQEEDRSCHQTANHRKYRLMVDRLNFKEALRSHNATIGLDAWLQRASAEERSSPCVVHPAIFSSGETLNEGNGFCLSSQVFESKTAKVGRGLDLVSFVTVGACLSVGVKTLALERDCWRNFRGTFLY
ncbi:hypothetical protein Q7P37_001593 [Cladosporium fusiforme]